MKLVSSTVLVGVLSLLSAATPGVEAANRHAGTRRQLDLQDGQTGGQLQKRVPLAPRELPPLQVGPKFRMARRSSTSAGTGNVKRAPLAKAEPAAHAGFGAVPMMNIDTAPIVGMVNKRGDIMHAHNGEQGTAVDVSLAKSDSSASTSSSSNNSSGSSSGTTTSTSSSDNGDNEEECDAEDDEDDEEDCDEEDEGEDDEEDCDEEEDGDDTTTTTTTSDSSSDDSSSGNSTDTSSSSGTVSANINVNLKDTSSGSKKANSGGDSSSSSSGSGSSATSSSSASSSSSTGTSSSGGSSNGQTFTGISTWYTQNGNAGACGKVNPDSAHVIALYTSAYANGANCGRTVEIQNLDDGTSTTAVVADMCPSCGGPGDIDLSVGTFSAIDPQYQTHGVRNIKWWYTS